ncbi:MAG: IclR family transcriptional regulator [Afipia sp.]|nr:IclR family transcriptional regulator [Afipia sp.]
MTTITHAAGILRLLASGVNQITSLANELNEPKSKVHRILTEMAEVGFVVRDPVKRHYYLGPLFLRLTEDPHQAHQRLLKTVAADMRHLHTLTEETVAIHIQIGTQKYCLEEIRGTHSLTFTAGKGSYAQIYAGASGKALLAQLSDAELDHVLQHVPLVKVGETTITDKSLLQDDIRGARERGYAESIGERIPQSACVSAPIYGYAVPASISVFGPDFRFAAKMGEVGPLVVSIAKKISRSLQLTT